jgi:hypothetical protein
MYPRFEDKLFGYHSRESIWNDFRGQRSLIPVDVWLLPNVLSYPRFKDNYVFFVIFDADYLSSIRRY